MGIVSGNCVEKIKSGCIVIFLIALFYVFLPDTPLFAQKYSTYNWFWMFYEYEKTDTAMSFTCRPFFMRNVTKGVMFDASLMPVFYWRYKTDKKDSYKGLFGLMGSEDYVHTDGVKDFDLIFFPFILKFKLLASMSPR